jgi:hypothetical protein
MQPKDAVEVSLGRQYIRWLQDRGTVRGNVEELRHGDADLNQPEPDLVCRTSTGVLAIEITAGYCCGARAASIWQPIRSAPAASTRWMGPGDGSCGHVLSGDETVDVLDGLLDAKSLKSYVSYSRILLDLRPLGTSTSVGASVANALIDRIGEPCAPWVDLALQSCVGSTSASFFVAWPPLTE